MSTLGHHVRARLESDRLLHCSAAQRRGLVRAVHRTAKPWPVLAFGCAGVHLHLVVKADFREAGELARRFEISLQRRHDYGCPFLKVHRKALEDQHHLFASAIYDMRQREHHELAADPYLEATSAPDLLGARLIGAYLIPRAREHLPELRHRDLLRLYGIESLEPAEAWESPAALLDATLATFTLKDMEGISHDVRQARHCLVQLAGRELTERELTELCCSSPRTIRRMRAQPAPKEHERAVRIQLDLRQKVQRRMKAEGELGRG